VPTVLQILAQMPEFETRDLSSLRVVAWGGAALPVDVVRTYRRLGVHLQTVYGQTEIISNATWSRPGDSDDALATTVGRVNPEADVRIVDDDGRDVGDGEEGEVLYRHPSQFLGYFDNPEATARTVTADGFVRTGDMAVRRPDGNVVLVGRRSDMYKSGGLNVYPREVELQLEEHPAVALAAIVSVPDAKFGEVGVAYVAQRPGVAPVSPDELATWCRARVAGYKLPKRFEVRDELPLLPIGKVDKQRLKRDARG
jgi:acyl-CoA synthetase (AMP-forming)/AMP-acid ligase II